MARTITVPAGARAAPRAPKRLLSLRGDDHLVERVRKGDEPAFEVLFERHVSGILSFCRHMLGSREEAEDAVQQVFAAAHRQLLRDSREIRLKPWLYAIARNRCLSILRARREQPGEELDGSTAGLDDEVERRAELRELVADLHDLPEDQRAALVLSELRDLSHAEVAEALGCEVANVKGLVFRARSGLIDRREARAAACEDIQRELATAVGGTLRRSKLRHHLRGCSACSDYLEQVRRQRKMMALVLPVVPTAGFKNGVLAAVGIGGGAAGGGGGAAGGALVAAALPATGATLAKVAAVSVLVGGAGIAGEATLDERGRPPSSPPAVTPESSIEAPRAPLDGVGAAGASERSSGQSSLPARGMRGRKAKRRAALRRGHGRSKRRAANHAPAQRKLGLSKPRPVRGGLERAVRAPTPVRAHGTPALKPEPLAPVRPERGTGTRALVEERVRAPRGRRDKSDP